MVKYFNKKNLIIIFSILLVLAYGTLCLNIYSSTLSNFKECFNNANYLKANSIILNEGTLNPIKKLKIKNDLNIYFSDFIEKLKTDYENNDISQEYIASTLREIERYDIVNSKAIELEESLPLFINSKNAFEKGVELFNNKDYVGAMKSFNEVSPLWPEYIKVLDYEKQCYSSIKDDTLSKANDLVKDKYYSKAITLIQENLALFKNNTELSAKLKEYEDQKTKYIASNYNQESQAASKSYTVLTKSNINTFDIASGTSYLIFVNTDSQKTYVYKGIKNKWSLVKEFLCSTGIKGEETPKGSFTVKEKGPWFYADKYKQGAKYYVGFMDNYLFHSLPFDKDKKKIVDTTLGKPASHGCIRLKVDESKWIYDNIPIGSKVIVN